MNPRSSNTPANHRLTMATMTGLDAGTAESVERA